MARRLMSYKAWQRVATAMSFRSAPLGHTHAKFIILHVVLGCSFPYTAVPTLDFASRIVTYIGNVSSVQKSVIVLERASTRQSAVYASEGGEDAPGKGP